MLKIFFNFLFFFLLIFSSNFSFSSDWNDDDNPRKFLFHGTGQEMTEEEFYPLSQRDDFTQISLSNCVFEDFSFLKKMTQLKFLALNNTNFSDEGDEHNCIFSYLNNLQDLNLQETNFTNTELLIPAKSIRVLNLKRCNIQDISALKDLVRLKVLNLAGTKIQDISALADLEFLESLNISGTFVKDIGPLKNLVKLKSLEVIDTPIQDFSPVSSQEHLQITKGVNEDPIPCKFL